jgi:HD-like signal output (HDOD) protein
MGIGTPVATIDERVTNLVAGCKLPTFPSVALRLMQLISQDAVSYEQLGSLLRTDAALSASMLRAANSPLFGTLGEIRSIPIALLTLGMDRVGMLILNTAMWRMVPGGRGRQSMRPWWRHNLATALLSKHLSYKNMVDEYSYMCGLMHSIGQLVLFEAFPIQYGKVLTQAAEEGLNVLDLERNNFGVEHCELGAALLKKWSIPGEMVDAAAHHHDPENATSATTRLVSMGCTIATQFGFAVAPAQPKPVADLPLQIQELLSDEKLRQEIAERVDAMEWTLN